MRVILFPSSVEPVGVTVHVIGLARILVRTGTAVCVACPAHGWLSDRLDAMGIPYKIIGVGTHWHQYIPSVYRLIRLLTSNNSNGQLVVHVHGRMPLFLSLLPMLVLRNTCFVATVHQFLEVGRRGIGGWRNALETALLRRVKRVWCVSRGLRNEVVQRIGPSHSDLVEVIPNWIERTSEQRKSRLHADIVEGANVRVCGVGRLTYEKGFDILVEAIGAMAKAGWNITCDIYGTGIERAPLNKQIAKLGVKERVVLKGAVDDVRRILTDYDALVIPSRSESFSIVALEAFDVGVPVVASNVPGLSEVVIDEETGVSFERGDVQSLVRSLERLFRSMELAKKVSHIAELSLEKYTPTSELEERIATFYSDATRQ